METIRHFLLTAVIPDHRARWSVLLTAWGTELLGGWLQELAPAKSRRSWKREVSCRSHLIPQLRKGSRALSPAFSLDLLRTSVHEWGVTGPHIWGHLHYIWFRVVYLKPPPIKKIRNVFYFYSALSEELNSPRKKLWVHPFYMEPLQNHARWRMGASAPYLPKILFGSPDSWLAPWAQRTPAVKAD